eukprot:NODE_943_length_2861_cov_0.133961.p3 type:complete len:133 gc:universal NODE_943_length_2861_cov_0.133961:656-1054(+)
MFSNNLTYPSWCSLDLFFNLVSMFTRLRYSCCHNWTISCINPANLGSSSRVLGMLSTKVKGFGSCKTSITSTFFERKALLRPVSTTAAFLSDGLIIVCFFMFLKFEIGSTFLFFLYFATGIADSSKSVTLNA